jgi:hypothetical protein
VPGLIVRQATCCEAAEGNMQDGMPSTGESPSGHGDARGSFHTPAIAP